MKDAVAFYEGKVEELDRNLKELDQILQGKAGNLRIVEECKFVFLQRELVMADDLVDLRQKVLSSNGAATTAAS